MQSSITKKNWNVWYVIVGALIVCQCVVTIYVLVNEERENECSNYNWTALNFFQSNPSAIRSNNLFTAILDVITSLVPFIILYIVPFFEAIRSKYRVEGITSDGIVLWMLAFVNVILKNTWKEHRPDAYRKCILDKISYGQPSGHAMWSVALAVTCLFYFTFPSKNVRSWMYELYNIPKGWSWKQICQRSCRYWKHWCWAVVIDILLIINVPFVRFEMQYHTWQQILWGMFFGLVVGAVIGALLVRFSRLTEIVWLRFLCCVLWFCTNWAYNNVLWAPLLCESVILIFQFRRERSPTMEGYNNVSLDDTNLDDKNKEMVVEELKF